MTFKRHYFKCHQQSKITEDTVEPLSLSKKLISKHTYMIKKVKG